MDLDYSILWIEDDREWAESAAELHEEALREHIRTNGFRPIIEKRFEEADILREVDGAIYDLLLVDLNLNYTTGSQIIQALQSQALTTDVLFYSSSSIDRLRQEVATRELDGVFVASREQLFPNARKVFDFTIRKVVDLPNMRGLVMTGVAEIDHLVTQVIHEKHAVLADDPRIDLAKAIARRLTPEHKELLAHREGVDDALKGRLKEVLKAIGELPPVELAKMTGDLRFGSMLRARTVEDICKTHEYLSGHVGRTAELPTLLRWRNALAHQAPTAAEDGTLTFKLSGTESGKFDHATALVLRKDIQRHQDGLKDVLRLIADVAAAKAEAAAKPSGETGRKTKPRGRELRP
jgi:CheY-like chemotaxis protein